MTAQLIKLLTVTRYHKWWGFTSMFGMAMGPTQTARGSFPIDL